MDNKEYEIEIEKQKTKREMIQAIFWLGFWFLIISGCTTYDVLMS